jgi:hypothetical protein
LDKGKVEGAMGESENHHGESQNRQLDGER